MRGGDAVFLSRNGQFERGNDGRLLNPQGFALQSAEGGDLMVSADAQILSDGTILENGLPVAHVSLVAPDDLEALSSLDGGLFQLPDGANAAQVATPIIHSGMLEASNVDGAAQMLEMMASMRQAEAGARVVQTYDALIGQAITAFGKSGS
jgi:flagellar basal-body rod protein FlgG